MNFKNNFARSFSALLSPAMVDKVECQFDDEDFTDDTRKALADVRKKISEEIKLEGKQLANNKIEEKVEEKTDSINKDKELLSKNVKNQRKTLDDQAETINKLRKEIVKLNAENNLLKNKSRITSPVEITSTVAATNGFLTIKENQNNISGNTNQLPLGSGDWIDIKVNGSDLWGEDEHEKITESKN